MSSLTLEEAKSLANVFGDLDNDQATILLLFDRPRNKHQAYVQSASFPRSFRIPMASIYRKVDDLCNLFFLELVDSRTYMKSDNLRGTGNYYQRTLKGLLAAYIYAYVLVLDKGTPREVVERMELRDYIRVLESSKGATLFVDFLRWNKNRGSDLSRVKVDMKDLALSFLHYALDNPEAISEVDISNALKAMKEFGFETPRVAPGEIRKLFLSSTKPLAEMSEGIYSLVHKKWSKKKGNTE